jgi:hypothetical protein
MSLLGGFIIATGPALFLLSGATFLRRLALVDRSAGPARRLVTQRRRRHAFVLLGASAAGAALAAIALGADRVLDSGWALLVMGAAIGTLVGMLAIASFDEADPLGQAEEGWGPAPGDEPDAG